jgi:hypothetical protein
VGETSVWQEGVYSVDPVVLAALVVLRLQTIVSTSFPIARCYW